MTNNTGNLIYKAPYGHIFRGAGEWHLQHLMLQQLREINQFPSPLLSHPY